MPASLGKDFYPKLVQISSEVGMTPEDLIAVMISESGMNAGASNPNGGATGLIQFMPNTLKSLKYEGSSKDFGKLNGEAQLDWIKKYILNQTKMNGGPFTSAAQYYVANFFPVALKLPGIKKGDPSTIFVEENPKTVSVNGKIYSKKYYDVGIKLHPKSEISAYKANPGFHGSVPGAISYADMIKQIEKNKKNPKYSQALAAMMQQTNYSPSKQSPRYIANNQPTKSNTNMGKLNQMADNLIKMVNAGHRNFNEYFVIKLSSNDDLYASEYARILCFALNEEFGFKTNINNIENLEINVSSNLDDGSNIITSFCNKMYNDFKSCTKKVFSYDVDTQIIKTCSVKNNFSSKIAKSNHRRFLLKYCK